jgi:hypothetical protein
MTITRQERLRLAFATGVAFLLCGLLLWPIPYSEVSLLGGKPSTALWFVAGTAAAVLAGFLYRKTFIAAMLTVPVGFAGAVLGRVVVEGLADPTSHNMWPVEVAIAMAVGAVAGVAGVGVARMLQRLPSLPSLRSG